MHKLLEDRMKELSANDMEVWLYDVKRNQAVKRGRQEQERAAKVREESVLDLEIDFLAPYLQRFAHHETLSKSQALEIRDECLKNVKIGLREKEVELEESLMRLKDELETKKPFLAQEDINSKKFYINVMDARLKRQQKHSFEFYVNAEKAVSNDDRLADALKS